MILFLCDLARSMVFAGIVSKEKDSVSFVVDLRYEGEGEENQWLAEIRWDLRSLN